MKAEQEQLAGVAPEGMQGRRQEVVRDVVVEGALGRAHAVLEELRPSPDEGTVQKLPCLPAERALNHVGEPPPQFLRLVSGDATAIVGAEDVLEHGLVPEQRAARVDVLDEPPQFAQGVLDRRRRQEQDGRYIDHPADPVRHQRLRAFLVIDAGPVVTAVNPGEDFVRLINQAEVPGRGREARRSCLATSVLAPREKHAPPWASTDGSTASTASISNRSPGGRGWLPTPGSRRSGRAQFEHPAPRAVVSLRATRAPTSRHFRRLPATCRTSFSFAWRYHAAALFAPAGVGRSPGPDCCLPRPSMPHLRWRRRDLPGSWATRACMPRSRTPAEPSAPDHLGAAMVPSALVTASATAMFTNFVAQSRGLQGFLCTLRRERHHWPRNTRFRLAGQPWPVRTRTCWVAKKVSVMSQHVFPLHQASPSARQARPATGRGAGRGTTMRMRVAPSASSWAITRPALIVFPSPTSSARMQPPSGIRRRANITASIWWGVGSTRPRRCDDTWRRRSPARR